VSASISTPVRPSVSTCAVQRTSLARVLVAIQQQASAGSAEETAFSGCYAFNLCR
jgi:hypothetical protein